MKHINKVLWSFLLISSLLGCSEEKDDSVSDKELPYAIIGENSNMPSGGIIIAEFDDAPPGEGIARMVDADADTKYTTGHNAFSIVWNGDQRAAVSSYSLTSAAESAGKDPKSWTLSASNDNKIWITLDSKEGETFKERKETRVFHIENATAYKYYKLDIKDNHGSTQTQIAEWTLNQEEAIINIDDLIERHGSGFTYSDSNPMGTQYENKHTTTKQDREWLANPANEPLLLPDTPGLTQFKEFSVNLYPFGDPVPADVNQYAIGDCWALAIFASFAYQCPDFIKSIITKNADNTFTVRMFDPQGGTGGCLYQAHLPGRRFRQHWSGHRKKECPDMGHRIGKGNDEMEKDIPGKSGHQRHRRLSGIAHVYRCRRLFRL